MTFHDSTNTAMFHQLKTNIVLLNMLERDESNDDMA